MTTITAEQRADIKRREAVLAAYCKAQGFTSKSGWTSYKPEQVAHLNPPTNEERSAAEVFDFMRDKPTRCFLYVNVHRHEATTWTGDRLGLVDFGPSWRDNFGGKRRSVRVHAINGCEYAGTYFESAGDYARVKRVGA